MPVLSPTDIEEIRDAFRETMPTTCTIMREERDDAGLSTGTLTTIASGVPCQIRQGGAGTTPVQNTGRGTRTAKLQASRVCDICYYDGLELGDEVTPDDTGLVYTVLNAPQDTSYLFLVSADVAEQAGGQGAG